jgi:hypothetical protein
MAAIYFINRDGSFEFILKPIDTISVPKRKKSPLLKDRTFEMEIAYGKAIGAPDGFEKELKKEAYFGQFFKDNPNLGNNLCNHGHQESTSFDPSIYDEGKITQDNIPDISWESFLTSEKIPDKKALDIPQNCEVEGLYQEQSEPLNFLEDSRSSEISEEENLLNPTIQEEKVIGSNQETQLTHTKPAKVFIVNHNVFVYCNGRFTSNLNTSYGFVAESTQPLQYLMVPP